ncbi:hypothetical protein [Capnocytophaga sputigena]|uniref:hypothetical protein n=1 Tax=Capnocytophaga sputigena TaxID=1019 RepID=UPI003CD0C48E
MKAIHNASVRVLYRQYDVINHKITKFESNSQQWKEGDMHKEVVINHKTTKFESNSQQSERKTGILHCCYQSQNYKI